MRSSRWTSSSRSGASIRCRRPAGSGTDLGYLPEAMVNYLALIGWSPGTEDEIFTMDELIAKWRIDQVQKAGGKWDRSRLSPRGDGELPRAHRVVSGHGG